MTLRNEIFEGLGAATAAQKLVYDPRDDYYEQVAEAAKRENQRRSKQDAEYDKNVADAKARARGAPGSAAPAGVPTAASSATPQQPVIPGAPVPPTPNQQQSSAFPSVGGGSGLPTDLSPSAVDPPVMQRGARGGRIGRQAIKLRYRAGGAVTPHADDDVGPSDEDDESPEAPDVPRMQPMPHFQRRQQGDGGTPRNPKLSSRPDDPALIRKPWTDNEPWEGEWEGSPEDDPDFDYGTPRHPHAFQRGGAVDDDNPADAIVKALLARSGVDSLSDQQRRYQMENTKAIQTGPQPTVEGSPVITPTSDEERRRRSYVPPRLTGSDETGVEGSPNIAPPLARYTPPRVGGEDTPTTPSWPTPPPPPVTRDDSPRFVDETVNRPKPVFDPRPYGREFNASDPIQADESRALQPVTPSAPGFEGAQPYAPIDPSETVGGAARKLFPPTSSPAPETPPVGAGAGTASGTQQAAAAPGTGGPKGTTTPPAPPTGAGAANAPSTAPKSGEGYQRFQPTERMAMRPDAPSWNPLGMDLRAPARAASGGGGNAVSTGTPPHLSMSDPNRVAAFDPTPGGADMTDPTRRRTDISEALIGASTQGNLGPNGELPPVGDKALSRPVGQQLVQAYSQGGRLEPGEAVLAGMMAGYRTLLSQNRVGEANSMAYAVMQYANIEAASHAYVAADRVRAGDFLGALQGVAAAATWLPDGMKHEVGPDGRSIITKDYTGKVTAVTPVDGRWLLAAIEGFKNGDLLWQTLSAAAEHLKGSTDKNAEGRELGKEIQRNTIELQRMRLKRGLPAPKGPAMVSDLEKRAAEIAQNLGGRAPPPGAFPVTPQGSSDGEYTDPAQQYSTGYDYNQEAPG